MKIGILECGHAVDAVRATHGDFNDMFQRLLAGHGFEFVTFDVEKMEFPETADVADGWLLTGSRHGVYEDHPFIAPLEDFVRESVAKDIPLVGICFGHQLIAQALGGRVEKFTGGWAVGHTDYQFDGIGNLSLNAWHQDQVIELPEGAQVIASNPFCQNAAIVYGKNALTVQPHPEMDQPVMANYLDVRKDDPAYPTDVIRSAISKSNKPTDENKIAQMIADFFVTARKHANV